MKSPYPVITTDAFILHTRASGEADRIITFLTRDAGVFNAHARSIRKENAKMRGAARPYARVLVSAVLGRRTILKDLIITDPLTAVWNDAEKYRAFVRLLRYVRSSVPVGIRPDSRLFAIVETAADYIAEHEPEDAVNAFLTAQIMLLRAFGYAEGDDPFKNLFADFSVPSKRRTQLIRQIETALYHQ